MRLFYETNYQHQLREDLYSFINTTGVLCFASYLIRKQH
jgi:hypothetical protein